MYALSEHADIGRVLVFVTYLFVGILAARKAVLLLADGERCTDRLCLVSGIAMTFLANAAWSVWAWIHHQAPMSITEFVYYDVLLIIIALVLAGGLIHVRTFTLVRCRYCWLIWLSGLVGIAVGLAR